jgi:hypothetical protein
MKAATKSYKSFNTLKQYFSLGSTDYWHIKYPLNNCWEDYYWDMSDKAFRCELERDKEGITMYIGEDGKMYYSSIELIQYAMASYQAFLKTQDEYWLNECITHTEKYLSFATKYKKANFTVLNSYPISLYGIYDQWPSALSLGVALSLLCRLYLRFDDRRHLDAAILLFENFRLDVNEGGVLRKVNSIHVRNNLHILEEYPSMEISGVLNGHITALWGLFDLGKHHKESKDFFIELSNELSENLFLWDNPKWSNYDIAYLCSKKKNKASIHYHMLHIQQLFVMYKITSNSVFAAAAENMIRQKFSVRFRILAFFSKLFFRVF